MSMTYDRQREILNNVVNNVSVARNTKETIQKLLSLGFTTEELYNDYRFSLSDLKDAEEDMDEYSDEEL